MTKLMRNIGAAGPALTLHPQGDASTTTTLADVYCYNSQQSISKMQNLSFYFSLSFNTTYIKSKQGFNVKQVYIKRAG